jgi:3-methyladenine DNA glycosylase/8-oxoguanine DNA glycosylase
MTATCSWSARDLALDWPWHAALPRPGRTLAEVSQAWRHYRTWAAVHLRALREQRTGEIAAR